LPTKTSELKATLVFRLSVNIIEHGYSPMSAEEVAFAGTVKELEALSQKMKRAALPKSGLTVTWSPSLS